MMLRSPNLWAGGPRLSLWVGVSLRARLLFIQAGRPVPNHIVANAMIDTGATNTVIRQGIAHKLQLAPRGQTNTGTTSHAFVPCYTYYVNVAFSKTVYFHTVATEMLLPFQNVDCLIGRDILYHAHFEYYGPSNQYRLTFPNIVQPYPLSSLP